MSPVFPNHNRFLLEVPGTLVHLQFRQGPWNADLRTPPGPEGSNGSLLCVCRGHPGILHLRGGVNDLGSCLRSRIAPQIENRKSFMTYQVIARKYRPQRFTDVVGQEHVTQTLANAIAQQRIGHAYLFCGPRGTGKTTIARIFAKCLNATNGPTVDFADDDPLCMEITEGRSLDVLEIDAASNRGIDEIRGLREAVNYMPAKGRFKIYIIDEVHMLTKEAFNALLKTLEEPPAHVKFMFATTEPEKVLATILSRCQRFDLRRIPIAQIVKYITEIATREQVSLDPAAVYAIARSADGGLRDAASTLDQLISFCGERIEENDVLSMFGLTAQKQLLDLTQAVLTGDVPAALAQLDQLTHRGTDLSRLLSDLLNHFRNLLLFQVSGGDLNLLEISEVEASALKDQAALLTPDAATRIMEVLVDAEFRLRNTASKQILLEITLLKAIEARQAVSLDSVLKILKQLRSEAPPAPETGAPPAQPAPENPAPAAARRPSATSPAREHSSPQPAPAMALSETAGDPGDWEGLWARVLEAVGRVSQFTKGYLVHAHPVSFAQKVLTIGFEPEHAAYIDLVNHSRTHEILQTKLSELGYPGTQIKFVKTGAAKAFVPPPTETPVPADSPATAPAAAAPPPPRSAGKAPAKSAPPPVSQEDFKNDPLIQKALELFKGQLANVG